MLEARGLVAVDKEQSDAARTVTDPAAQAVLEASSQVFDSLISTLGFACLATLGVLALTLALDGFRKRDKSAALLLAPPPPAAPIPTASATAALLPRLQIELNRPIRSKPSSPTRATSRVQLVSQAGKPLIAFDEHVVHDSLPHMLMRGPCDVASTLLQPCGQHVDERANSPSRRHTPPIPCPHSDEGAVPGDVAPDDEGLDLGSALVGHEGFHVA